ncbi:hypothetical protein L2E82_12983 [Cichorium intybus]|uniref:Uncharacterized protein n=1 Tax=Cichorium intybus TaxID=13427 RepID=A0ACB9GHB4_CICIN|nr:hypothetical protein L2E82_12983 [Cichorium intybus]
MEFEKSQNQYQQSENTEEHNTKQRYSKDQSRKRTKESWGLDEYALLPPAYREHSHGKRQSVGLSFFSMKLVGFLVEAEAVLSPLKQ